MEPPQDEALLKLQKKHQILYPEKYLPTPNGQLKGATNKEYKDLDALRKPKQRTIDSPDYDPKPWRERDQQEHDGFIPGAHNLSKKPQGSKRCLALTHTGKACKNNAKYGNFCAHHKSKNPSAFVPASGPIYAHYAPSLRGAMEKMQHIHENMWEEVTLLRGLLASTLVMYNEGADVLDQLITVVDQLRKVLDYQSKFLPNKRPVDEKAISIVVEKMVTVIQNEVEDSNILENIIIKLDSTLSEVTNAEEKSIAGLRSSNQQLNSQRG